MDDEKENAQRKGAVEFNRRNRFFGIEAQDRGEFAFP
jgi:hypothetical protein